VEVIPLLERLSKKQIRIGLGIVMMQCFIMFFSLIGFFFSQADGSIIAVLWGLCVYFYMWVPTIFCIVIIYLLLTRVFKYDPGDYKK